MFSALKQFFHADTAQLAAHHAYIAVVTQARNPAFYQTYGVADTVDGRFDAIALHMFFLIHRLQRENSAHANDFIRAVSEVFFADMDQSLREMGSTDTGVGMRVKKMVKAFYGRLYAYEQSNQADNGWQESVQRNLFRGKAVDAASLQAITGYIQRNLHCLNVQTLPTLLEGRIAFSE